MPLIGVAIAIPEPHGTDLQDARARFGDPLAAAIPTHVTLLPPTDIDAGDLPKVAEHLEHIAAALWPFGMRLRGTGTFRPISPVVFVEIVQGAAECQQIETSVRSGPLSRELDFPYSPHVTIAHHLPEERMDAAAAALVRYDVTFDVRGFSHYLHGIDGVWRPAREYLFSAISPATNLSQ